MGQGKDLGDLVVGFGIIYYIILIICGIFWAVSINLILGLIMIGFGILGFFYCVLFSIKIDENEGVLGESLYWSIIAPLHWGITAFWIYFRGFWRVFGVNFPIMTTWLISSFYWYVIPILGIIFARYGDEIVREIKSHPKLFYYLLFAPIGFLITSNVILFSLGYKLSDYNTFIPIWLISSLFWFIVPTLIFLMVKLKIFTNHIIEKKIETKEMEANKFENLIKKSKGLINKSKKQISKESYAAAVENWKEAINCFNLALKKAITLDEKDMKNLRDNIYDLYLRFLSINPLLTNGSSIIFQDNKIILKKIYGLNIFLATWFKGRVMNKMDELHILEFLRNFDDYSDYSKKILKFIHDKGRAPEKDEAWDLVIPIDEMDLVLDIINIKIA